MARLKKRHVVTIWIVSMLIAAVFFLEAVTSSDKNVELSAIVPFVMAVPFVIIGAVLLFYYKEKEK